MRLRPAVFLDRDGVINEPVAVDGEPRSPAAVDELVLAEGVVEACQRMRSAGLLLVVVTNQPEVARGRIRAEAVDAIHAELCRRVPINAVFVCPHDDADRCACRKPSPGMLLRAARELDVDLDRSVMIGDRRPDMDAGRRAGCATVLIARDYAEPRPSADLSVASLLDAVPWILDRTAAAVPSLWGLKVKIFADGADEAAIIRLASDPLIKGFTTNPTLIRAAGVSDYEGFARRFVRTVPGRPVSFGVIADEPDEMARQARVIASWGDWVYVKIPVTTTRGEPCTELVRRLGAEGIRLNVTALLTLEQIRAAAESLAEASPSFISVFAGRIADTGRDPVPQMRRALEIVARSPHLQLVWASPREVLNVIQADAIGCHVITLTSEQLRKLPMIGRDLDQVSLDTVEMFHRDAQSAGLTLTGHP